MPSFLGLPSPPKEIIPAPPAFPCQESGCTSTFSSMTQLQYHNSVHERQRPKPASTESDPVILETPADDKKPVEENHENMDEDPVMLETPAIDEGNKELASENDLKVDSSENIEASQISRTDDRKPLEENNDKKDETIHNLTDISELKRPDENESGIVLEKQGNTSTPMRKSSANLKSEGKLEPSSNKVSAKTFHCPYCESKFSQKHNLKSHVKQKHEENFNKTDFRNIKVEISNDLENNLKNPPINRKRKSIGESGNVKKPHQISKVQTQSEEKVGNLEEIEIDDVEPTETQKLPIYVDPIKKPFVTMHQVMGEDDL